MSTIDRVGLTRFGSALLLLCLSTAAGVGYAQDSVVPKNRSSNFYGMPGLIETPSALSHPNGELVGSVSHFAGTTRFQFLAQVHPRIAGSFRYTQIQDFNAAGFGTYYDRSFDLRYTLIEESRDWPGLAIGLQDFIGTGIYGSEYLVASKDISRKLSVSAGLGWGRLSSDNRVSAGFGTRPPRTAAAVAEGGEPNVDSLFRGDIGAFGGFELRLNDRTTLKAELSSDAYALEDNDLGIFSRKSPLNVGLEYALSDSNRIGAYYLYGSEIGLMFSFAFNPDRPATLGSLDSGPLPVISRPDQAAFPAAYSEAWVDDQTQLTGLRERVSAELLTQRLEMEALSLSPTSATLYLRNTGYLSQAQATGRAARVLARHLPSSVNSFTVAPVSNSMVLPAITLLRSDVERLEAAPEGPEAIQTAATFDVAAGAPTRTERAAGIYPRFSWRVSPFLATSLFDPDDPVRADFGAELSANLQLRPGTILSAAGRKKIVGNLDESTRESNSQLPRVRSDFVRYDAEGDPNLEVLTAAQFARLPGDFYGRVTAGYLERMFAGVSSELLWAPFDSRISLGAELNYVRQRDFQGGFGLQDYDVVTGHGSLYYRFNDDFFAQLDAGRYLAGDEGATFTLDRVFANGWRIGAFATFTNVSAEEFGEGSFDKGIRLTIPIGWFDGKSSAVAETFTMRPLQRDGGARLIVRDRLYEQVQRNQRPQLEEQWGRFWR